VTIAKPPPPPSSAPSLEDLSADYAAEHLTAEAAAASGFVDEVIEPAWTRDRLVWALRSLGER
jgi:acetyl-CoA carboxylase carboxyltransferase component